MKTKNRFSILLLDASVFLTEFGALLTWLGTLTLATNFQEAAIYISYLWFANRIQRVLFAGAIGNFVDSVSKKISIFKFSAILYVITIFIFSTLKAEDNILLLAIMSFILPIFRQVSSIARMSYVKHTLEGSNLSKQVKLIETLPLLASGFSAVFIFTIGKDMGLQQLMILDFSLHVLSLLLISFINEDNISSSKKAFKIKDLFSFKKEFADTKVIISNTNLLRLSLELYSLILIFGSYPVIVNIVAGQNVNSKEFYTSYYMGLAIGTLLSLILSQSRLLNTSSNLLKQLLPLIIIAAVLQIIGVYNFNLNSTENNILIFSVGTLVTMIFVIYMTQLRSELVATCSKENIGFSLATISRFEFLFAAILAMLVGLSVKTTDTITTTTLLGLFAIPLIIIRNRSFKIAIALLVLFFSYAVYNMKHLPKELINQEPYKIAYAYKFEDINPQSHTNYSKHILIRQLFDTLVGLDNNLNFIPRLAESWTSVSKTETVFKLKVAYFNTGEMITPKDVELSLLRAKTFRPELFEKVNSIVAGDNNTIKISSALKLHELLRLLTLTPTSITRYQQSKYLTSGPYKLVDADFKNGVINISSNEKYYKPLTQADIQFIFSAPNQVLELFKNKQIDEADTGNFPELLNIDIENKGIIKNSVNVFLPITDMLIFNLKSPFFKNLENRELFTNLWHRLEVSEKFWITTIKPTGFIPLGINGHVIKQEPLNHVHKVLSTPVVVKIGTLIKDRGESIESYFNDNANKIKSSTKVKIIYYASSAKLIEDLKKGSLDARIISNTPKDYDGKSLLLTFYSNSSDNVYNIKDVDIDQLLQKTSSHRSEKEYTDLLSNIDISVLNKYYGFPIAYRKAIKILRGDCPEFICDSSLVLWDRRMIKE